LKITVEIPGISNSERNHFIGILRSFFVVIEEILTRKRKASYLIHFFFERLEKDERRKFIFILIKIISSLTIRKTEISSKGIKITSSISGEIPQNYHNIISSFKGVSKIPKSSLQCPQGSGHTPKDGDVSEIIKKEILDVINSKRK
jgi:hypothetical protein